MTDSHRELYGSTSKQGCVPSAGCPGPVYSPDGLLIVSESFTAQAEPTQGLSSLGEDIDGELIETWRIWDCCENDWADIDLVLDRFEQNDVVTRATPEGACIWRGAIDTRARILASRDAEECKQKCWQWLRDTRNS